MAPKFDTAKGYALGWKGETKFPNTGVVFHLSAQTNKGPGTDPHGPLAGDNVRLPRIWHNKSGTKQSCFEPESMRVIAITVVTK